MTTEAIAAIGSADHGAAAFPPARSGDTGPEGAAPVVGCRPGGTGDPERLRHHLGSLVARYALANPEVVGVPVEAVRLWLGMADRRTVESLVCAPLAVRHRHVLPLAAGPHTPENLARPLMLLGEELAASPFRAPGPERLAELGFTRAGVATGVRTGLLVRLGPDAVLPTEAVDEAVRVLAGLREPFTVAEARRALDTRRRVAGPLLTLLDRRGLTRGAGDRRRALATADDPPFAPGRGRTVSP
ncbi:SelB domain-containing protein [Halostreptopolyspora alba]|uniref:Elongation factor SelB fourth winged-helix domain-containing protein n=1 Tax=Halostreptopolyspora alba TaxID=2487137 RepID=A0A3N0E4B4_9ACTN|nr:hypothetical protein EFW17_18525 [Nocardiopsaceae bacterium YIM 96095]